MQTTIRANAGLSIVMAFLGATFFGQSSAFAEDFDIFERPVPVAVVPLKGGVTDPELARAVEGMATRLLVESARYRVMLPWEARSVMANNGLVVRTDTPENARETARLLGVRYLASLKLTSSRRVVLSWVDRDGDPIVKTRVGTLSTTPELLDRDIGLLFEQAGALRAVYRVRAPFNVRKPRPNRELAAFDRVYPRVVRFLTNRKNDPSEKLALTEAVLEKFSGLEDRRFDAIVGARGHLLAGRAFFEKADDTACRETTDCKRFGTCRGSDIGCVAYSNADCRRAEVCTADGRCIAAGGECMAEAATCEHSYACLNEGRCEPHAGRCFVPDAMACESSKQCEQVNACSFVFGSCSRGAPTQVSAAE
ncbi:MAG: hypothetical protein AAF658_12145 [Myxococcota bacterium]